MGAPSSDVDVILRPFALGLATGARTTAGITTVALTPGGTNGPVGKLLMSKWAKRIIPVLCAQELIFDKLPKTPSRLGMPGFPARVITSALSGIAIAERDDADPLASVAFTVAGAGLGSVLGSGLRAFGKSHGWSDLPLALGEDLLAAAFAFIGVAAARDHT